MIMNFTVAESFLLKDFYYLFITINKVNFTSIAFDFIDKFAIVICLFNTECLLFYSYLKYHSLHYSLPTITFIIINFRLNFINFAVDFAIIMITFIIALNYHFITFIATVFIAL